MAVVSIYEITCQTFPYHQASKNGINDLHILQGPLWEEDFRCQRGKEARTSGANERNSLS
jgi:hypothetical protein